jgi:hypothetical protein
MSKDSKIVLCLVAIQFIAILFSFSQFLFSNTYISCDAYDGLKNLFTYYTYINQSDSTPLLMYDGMNYPFGEFVTFTDNTPLLAIPLRIFNNHVMDISSVIIQIHYWFYALGIIWASLFLWLILKRWVQNRLIIFIFCFTIPWISPQFLRIDFHFSLSCTWLLLANIWVCFKNKELKNTNFYIYLQGIFFVVAAGIHIYLLAFNILFSAAYYGIDLLLNLKNIELKAIKKYFFVGIIAFAVYIAFSILDPFASMRPIKSLGYNWDQWNLQFAGLFQSPQGYFISSPFYKNTFVNLEGKLYLGSLWIFGLPFLIFFLIKYFRKKETLFNKTALTFFIIGIVFFLISLGETIIIQKEKLSVTNYLNPFYYLHLFSDFVTHFRCLSRFFWLPYLLLYFLAAFILDKYIFKRYWNFIVIVLLMLPIHDTLSNIYLHSKISYPSIFKQSDRSNELRSLIGNLDVSDFDAILPIPYYHVGFENYDYIIDPDEEHCTNTYKLSMLTRLPLMSSKMSRTPELYAMQMLNWISNKSNIKKLKGKKILVYLDEERFKNGYIPTNTNAKEIYFDAYKLPKLYKMQLIKKQGDRSIFLWKL